MPGERRTFHSRRKFAHTGEYFELAEASLRRRRISGHQAMEPLEQRFGLLLGLALDTLRQHRRGSGGNRTSRAFEARVLDHAAFQLQIKRQSIATQRVETFRLPVSPVERAKVSRLPVVVEDDLLIEIA